MSKKDEERLNYYENLKKFKSGLFEELSNFETDEGKLKMKLKLLKLAYDKSLTKHVINLYLQVLREEYSDKSIKNSSKKLQNLWIKSTIKNYNSRNYLTNCLLRLLQ